MNSGEPIIVLDDVTKDYGNKRGIFAISFDVRKGECFGLVGENGAGKTTTIRHIMGFLTPDHGTIQIHGLDAFRSAPEIKRYIGYVPGEISLPPLSTGKEVLKSQMDLLGRTDFSEADRLIKKLQLNINAYPKRMSKGMKQKMALVMALMNDPEILILDEPTTGLDPLMRDEFISVLLEEKAKGKTILISSNSYDELETLSDRVALISQGHLITIADNNAIRNRSCEDFKIEFLTAEGAEGFKALGRFSVLREQPQYHQVTVEVPKEKLTALFEALTGFPVRFLTQVPYNLETYLTDVLQKKEEKSHEN
jgi:ABC-2 type transport system ATP-binding protein